MIFSARPCPGTVGKNLITLDFPTDQEMPDGTQAWLLKLRDSRLEDDVLLEEFYEKIIKNYAYGGKLLYHTDPRGI